MATYYVSYSFGNDASNGTTQNTAWKTLEYAQTNATTAGDIIALKKGDIWPTSTVVDISHGGTAGTYITWDGGLWGTGSTATLLSSSPTGYNSVVHIAGCKYLKFQNITIDVNHVNITGISIGGDNNSYGPTVQNDERYITIQDCSVLDVGDGTEYWIGILVQAVYTDMYNISVIRCTVDYAGAHCIAFYNDRLIQDPSDRKFTYDAYIGYNKVSNAGQAPFAANNILLNNGVERCIIEHNVVHQGTGACPGIALGHTEGDEQHQPRNVIVRYNNVHMVDQEGFIVYYGGNKSANVYYNLFYSENPALYKPPVAISAGDYTGGTFTFYNNVIIDNGSTNNVACFENDSYVTGTTTFRNNILISTKTESIVPLFYEGIDGGTIHSNNCYHRTLAGNDVIFINQGGPTYSRADVSTWEPTCQLIDPLFITNYSDLHLQESSPCINAGVDVSIAFDYDGITINDPPEIGAYEYSVEASTSTFQFAKFNNKYTKFTNKFVKF
jgi:hypothetical protein